MNRRAWFGNGIVAALAALLPWRAARAVNPTGIIEFSEQWQPLNTGPYTRVFRQEWQPTSIFRWVEIPWEDQRPGDDVIHFGCNGTSPLLCIRGKIKEFTHNSATLDYYDLMTP